IKTLFVTLSMVTTEYWIGPLARSRENGEMVNQSQGKSNECCLIMSYKHIDDFIRDLLQKHMRGGLWDIIDIKPFIEVTLHGSLFTNDNTAMYDWLEELHLSTSLAEDIVSEAMELTLDIKSYIKKNFGSVRYTGYCMTSG